MVQQLVFIILSKVTLMFEILDSQSPKFQSREICTDFQTSLLITSGTCLFLSKGMHSNVLVLVFGSHSGYAVYPVPVLPFLPLMHDVVMFCAYMQNVIVHTLCGIQSFANTQCILL